MDLYPIADAIELSPLGAGIRDSVWLFPTIEAVHLLALATLGGAALMVDLRLMGLGLRSQPASVLLRETRPWFHLALAVLFVTGVLLAVSEAVKLYNKPAFLLKMATLAAALLFTFLVRNPMVRRDPAGLGAILVAVVSLALWLTVAIAGRWIGFS